VRPADEPGPAESCTPLGRLAALPGQKTSHGALRRETRLDAQLPLQYRGAAVVGAHRARPVTEAGLQFHHGAIADLLEWPQLGAAAGDVDRSRQIAAAGPRGGQQVTQLHALAFELRPHIEKPVVVAARQEITPVHVEGRRRVRGDCLVIVGRQRRIPISGELPDVDSAGRCVLPAQIPRRDDQRRLAAENLPQVVQLAAQVGQRLRPRRIRPEQAGDALPALRCAGVDGEERDERDGARRAGPDRAGRPVDDHLLSQERDAQHRDPTSRRER
jgi:hypothetical protein